MTKLAPPRSYLPGPASSLPAPPVSRSPQSLLVTGGAGFIGSNFVRWVLSQTAARVVTLDALTYAGRLASLADLPDASRHTFVEGDVADDALVARVMEEHDVDLVVHFAAESHVDRSIHGPAAFVHANVVGTFGALEAARRVWGTRSDVRFHHISTDEVYGTLGPTDPAFTETTPYDPSSPYSATKAASDHLVRAYGRTYGLPVSVTNCSNNYGPYQFPEKLLPLTLLRALAGEPIPIYGDGQQVRDWLYVEDHCEAIWRVATEAEAGATYNVGGDNQPTNLELVRALCHVLDERQPGGAPHDRLITFVPDRPGHDRRYAMDTTAIRRDLGWAPRHTIDEGLEATVDWYLAHGDWLADVAGDEGYRLWEAAHYTDRAAS